MISMSSSAGCAMRLDVYLVANGYFPSRQKALAAIKAGLVMVDGIAAVKPSMPVSDQTVTVLPHVSYVSRGAYKLKKALDDFAIDLKDLRVLDIGASTGGFTELCLERGAAHVYALDAGSDQLADCLRNDHRVTVMEKTNFRYVDPHAFPAVDFICCDVSFISLTLLIPNMEKILKPGNRMVLLIKPQFEAGPEFLNKHGLVTSPKAHEAVLNKVSEALKAHHFALKHLTYSPLLGGEGNIEYLAEAVQGEKPAEIDFSAVVGEAFSDLGG